MIDWASLRPSKGIRVIIIAQSSSHIGRLVGVVVILSYDISSLVVR